MTTESIGEASVPPLQTAAANAESRVEPTTTAPKSNDFAHKRFCAYAPECVGYVRL